MSVLLQVQSQVGAAVYLALMSDLERFYSFVSSDVDIEYIQSIQMYVHTCMHTHYIHTHYIHPLLNAVQFEIISCFFLLMRL